MPGSTTYSQWVAEVANLVSGATAPSSFLSAELPSAIDYGEGRIYRDFNLLSTVVTDATESTALGSRNVTIPSGFFVIENVNVITPPANQPDAGIRNQLTKVSKSFLDYMWPSSAAPGIPSLYAFLNNTQIILGPWPNASGYVIEYEGTQRPAPLSATNPTTFITLNMPDLFLAATMVHIAGFMKNFGSQADNPAMAVSWESQYEKLSMGVDGEELRRRYANTGMLPPAGFDNMRPGPQKAA